MLDFFRHGLRWRIGLLLLAVTAINYIDRQALAIAAPVINAEFGLTKAEYGLITSGFLLAYAVGQGLAGWIVDRIGAKAGFSFAVCAWSIVGMLHVFGTGFWSFLGLRAGLGLFEGFNFPTAMKVVSEWFPKSDRALGASMVRIGTGLGAMIAPPLLAFLIHNYGWPAGFLIPGLIGFVWIGLWQISYQSPQFHPSLSERERKLIEYGRVRVADAEAQRGTWIELLRRRDVQGLMIARFFADNLQYFYVFWLPIYLSDARGFSLAQIGLFGWIPFLFSDAGGLFVGWLSGHMIRRGWSLNVARKSLLWIAGILVPISSLAAVAEDSMVALALISLGLFANQFKTTALFTLPMDLFPSGKVGAAWGLCGAAGSFGAMLFQPAIGMLSDQHAYGLIFALISLLPLLAAIIVSLTVRKIALADD